MLMQKLFITVFITLLSFSVHANRGYEIAKSVKKANEGFIGDTSTMEMHLINGDKKIVRSMISKNSEISPSENRSLLEFVLPKDVKGTKLLTWSFEKKDDSQWIYLPAFSKIKRISSSSKTSSFMGSEFTYEDLRAASVEKYNYKFIKEEKKDDDLFWVYERSSKEKSGYSKQVVTTSKKYMNVVAIDYYDRSGELLKQARVSGFKKFTVKGKDFWSPSKIEMKNIQTKKESVLFWKDRKLGEKIPEKEFKKNSLKR